MSRETYRKLLACLHPDHCGFAGAAAVFNDIVALEDVLVRDEPRGPLPPPLPQTVDEFLRRRRV
jgi:hypothetical protein